MAAKAARPCITLLSLPLTLSLQRLPRGTPFPPLDPALNHQDTLGHLITQQAEQAANISGEMSSVPSLPAIFRVYREGGARSERASESLDEVRVPLGTSVSGVGRRAITPKTAAFLVFAREDEATPGL